MTRVRHTARAKGSFIPNRALLISKSTETTKSKRVRGEKGPRTLVRFVPFSLRAHGLSVTPPSSGCVSRRVFGRRLRTNPMNDENTTVQKQRGTDR